jgi:hypothetical protein
VVVVDDEDEDEEVAYGEGAAAAAAAAAAPVAVADVRETRKRTMRLIFSPEGWTAGRKPPSKKRKMAVSVPNAFTAAVGSHRSYTVKQTTDMNALLLPFLLRNFSREHAEDGDSSRYNGLLERRFTDVITGIVGKKGFEVISAADGGARGAFEWTNAQTQCGSVLKLPDGTQLTLKNVPDGYPCWICQLPMTTEDKDPPRTLRKNGKTYTGLQCEHKLAVGLAVLFTGLYDTQLSRALKNATYVRELDVEYAWSHERCNQIKGQDPYVMDTNPTDIVVLQPHRTKINENLGKIWNTEYPEFIPLRDTLRGRAAPDTEAVWKGKAFQAITGHLQRVIDKVNGRSVPKSTIYAHFRRNVLLRARIAYDITAAPGAGVGKRPSVGARPKVVRRIRRNNPLRRGGSSTRRNRKGLRTTRRMRGGVLVPWWDKDLQRECLDLLDDTVGYVRSLLATYTEIVGLPDDGIGVDMTDQASIDARAESLHTAIARGYGDVFIETTFTIAETALRRALWETDYTDVTDEDLPGTIDTSIDWQVAVAIKQVGFDVSGYTDAEVTDAQSTNGFVESPAAAPAAATAPPQPSFLQQLTNPLRKRQKEEAPAANVMSVDTRGSQAPTLAASTFPGSAPPSPPRTVGNTGLLSPTGSQVQGTPSDRVPQASERPTEGRRRASNAADDVREALENSDDSLGGGFRFGRRPDWL